MVIMEMSMRAVTTLFLSFLTMALTIEISFCNGNPNVICIESEREALLRFKHDLKDPSNRLSSWATDDNNCCTWAGVVCNNLTSHVQELHLGNPSLDEVSWSSLGGKINPSLLNLKHLNYLDLSNNDFGGIQIPRFLGSLKSLRYLNLSTAGFQGMIPHELGNLSSLCYLDLKNPWLNVNNFQWILGLSSLTHLDLSYVNLSRAFDWLQVINILPSLVELHLFSCNLDHTTPLLKFNSSSLTILDLSWNQFNSSIPSLAFDSTSLVSLELNGCSFQGPIPLNLQNMTSLQHLDLFGNYFNSSIPNWLYSFRHLEFLNLGYNNLQGKISSAIKNLTSAILIDMSDNEKLEVDGGFADSLGKLCNLREIFFSGIKLSQDISKFLESFSVGCIVDGLESLYMSNGQLFGHLTDQLGLFKNLVYLSLNGNRISGPIPKSLGKLSFLKVLGMADNQLNGTLPRSLGKLAKLEVLRIFRNSLEGVVCEVHFANLTRLRILDASGNLLALKVSPNWVPAFQLEEIDMSFWHLGPRFPFWLRSQKSVGFLDISYTGISYTIPSWFYDFSSSLQYVNISHNEIHGYMPEIPQVVNPSFVIDMSSNHFKGALPHVSIHVTFLDLSNNSLSGSLSHFLCYKIDEENQLEALNLEKNMLSGEIPDCWMNWQRLKVINLGNNNFTGTIPSSMGALSFLQSIHLRNNSLSGELPSSLQNCTWLKTIDLGENEFDGSIPIWIGERLQNLRILILRSNKFHGHIPNELCALTSLQILDLAHNNLLGTIPRCFNNFSAMAIEQDSNRKMSYPFGWINDILENALLVTKGNVFEYRSILHLVTSMDLSNNNLSGEIPVEVTILLGLRWLNLSNNFFQGRIPNQIGAMKLLESIDFSMNQLSGEIPPSMSSLMFLSHLNLSYNNLTEKIPSSTQLQSFNASSFIGNKLCGPPLTENCIKNGELPNVVGNESSDEGDGSKFDWFYVNMGLGFWVGFWGVFGPVLINSSWRETFFGVLDRVWYKLCGVIRKCYHRF